MSEKNGKEPKSQNINTPNLSADVESAVLQVLAVPAGDVVVRRVRGPDGQHPIGFVVLARIYTISRDDAVKYCTGPNAEFEPVLTVDRESIDAAAKAAAAKAGEVAEAERKLAQMKSAK